MGAHLMDATDEAEPDEEARYYDASRSRSPSNQVRGPRASSPRLGNSRNMLLQRMRALMPQPPQQAREGVVASASVMRPLLAASEAFRDRPAARATPASSPSCRNSGRSLQ